MAATKFTLSFGLLTVPMKSSPAARPNQSTFKTLHKACNTPVKQGFHCTTCKEHFDSRDTVRGHEANGQFIPLNEQEIKQCQPEATKVITIDRMVPAGSIDSLFLESAQYLEPELAGVPGYALLLQALIEEKLEAVAHFSSHGHDHLALIRPHAGCLLIHKLYYADEVRVVPAMVGQSSAATINPDELELAKQLLRGNVREFDHKSYTDIYQTNLAVLLEKKTREAPMPQPGTKNAPAPVVDLLSALRASIEELPKPGPVAVPDKVGKKRKQRKAA